MPACEDTIPVIETYGPVLQGEGLLVGRPTWFVRLGACDYRCFFCDSMHAVDGKEVEKNKTVMSADDLAIRVLDEMKAIPLVTLSGGNPALWPMERFLHRMQANGKEVAIETQASINPYWLPLCDYITLSPKGPGMVDSKTVLNGRESLFTILQDIYERSEGAMEGVCIKIPVIDSSDLEFARTIEGGLRRRFTPPLEVPRYLSIGNLWVPEPAPLGKKPSDMPIGYHLRDRLLGRLDKISTSVMLQYPELHSWSILPQLHVLMHGNERGK